MVNWPKQNLQMFKISLKNRITNIGGCLIGTIKNVADR